MNEKTRNAAVVEELPIDYGADLREDEPEKKLSPGDALIRSLNMRGYPDLQYMSELSGETTDELIRLLNGRGIIQDPEVYDRVRDRCEGWMLPSQYVSGKNIYVLLEKARQMHAKYHCFAVNVRLLEDLERKIPPVSPDEDDVLPMGYAYMPAHILAKFIASLLGMSTMPAVERDPYYNTWSVRKNSDPAKVLNEVRYGTERMTGLQICRDLINGRQPKVYDISYNYVNGREERVLNRNQTEAAQEKARLIQQEYVKFFRKDPEVANVLPSLYRSITGYRISRIDGSFLELPGLNPAVRLYPHQKNAVARILMSRNTLVAHDVGSGKTYVLVCAAHELKRMGLSEKNMIVVPNNVFDQTVRMHRMLYPEDDILVIPPSAFTPARRAESVRKIRTEDHTAVYMASSSFDMFTMSLKYYEGIEKEKIRKCQDRMNETWNAAKRRPLENELGRLQKKLEKLQLSYKKTVSGCFDELGITALFVDEAHYYKNLPVSGATGFAGMHSAGSEKCIRLMDKIRSVQEGGGRIVFASGTILSNSITDLYVFQQYLQPQDLQFCGITGFSEWKGLFTEEVIEGRMDVDAQGYRMSAGFNRFRHLPQLMNIFSSVCDFYRPESGEMGLPVFRGYTDVVVKRSGGQAAYMKTLAERADLIRKGKVDREEDNLLNVTNDGRKCGLDIRLTGGESLRRSDPPCKAAVCAENIMTVYREYPGTSQIVFCDLSTPKAGFNIYDELRRLLTESGIPDAQIAYIHEGTNEKKRNELLDGVRSGRIRVMIGSTPKLGVGTNVQTKLIAVHHLDVPWKPADMEQRNKRLIRQGNTNPEVFIYRYVTESSFDAYVWQVIETKQRFICDFLSGMLPACSKEAGDIGRLVLDYAEIKALAIGNPLIRQRVEVSNRLERCRIHQGQRRMQLREMQRRLREFPEKEGLLCRAIRVVGGDASFYAERRTEISREFRARLGEHLLKAVAGNLEQSGERFFDWHQGFEIWLPKNMTAEDMHVLLRRKGGGQYKVMMDGHSAPGCVQRLDHVLNDLEARKARLEKKLEELQAEKGRAEREIAEGNPYDSAVEALSGELARLDKQLSAA